MSIKVTEYERVVEVHPTQLGQFNCPKCAGICNERSPEKRSPPKKRREFDCAKCGRGWLEVPAWVRTLSDAHKAADEDMMQEEVQEKFAPRGEGKYRGDASNGAGGGKHVIRKPIN